MLSNPTRMKPRIGSPWIRSRLRGRCHRQPTCFAPRKEPRTDLRSDRPAGMKPRKRARWSFGCCPCSRPRSDTRPPALPVRWVVLYETANCHPRKIANGDGVEVAPSSAGLRVSEAGVFWQPPDLAELALGWCRSGTGARTRWRCPAPSKTRQSEPCFADADLVNPQPPHRRSEMVTNWGWGVKSPDERRRKHLRAFGFGARDLGMRWTIPAWITFPATGESLPFQPLPCNNAISGNTKFDDGDLRRDTKTNGSDRTAEPARDNQVAVLLHHMPVGEPVAED